MKKLALILAPMALALSACVTTGTGTGGVAGAAGANIATAAVQVAVSAKCAVELNNNTYWKSATRLLTDVKKQELQSEVCGCVGQKATSSVTTTDLIIAAMDKTTQANLATKIVTQTLNACVVETFQN